jgi:AcrR family transcriptional regulator
MGTADGMKTRGRPRSAEADRAILDAAVALLSEEGYAGLAMHAVAQRAGVSTATLYRRFRDKEELVIAALGCLTVRREIPDTGSLEGDLTALLLGMIEVFHEDAGKIMGGMLMEVGKNPALGDRLRGNLIEPRRRELVQIFERAVDRGEIAPFDDAELVLDLLFGAIMQRSLMTNGELSPAVVARLVALVLPALRQPAQAAPNAS